MRGRSTAAAKLAGGAALATLVPLCGLSVVASARAQERTGGDALNVLREHLEGCTPLVDLPEEWDAEAEPFETLEVSEAAGGLVASLTFVGSGGVDSSMGGSELWVGDACAQVAADWHYGDGALVSLERVTRSDGVPDAAVVAVVGARGEPSLPAHALGALTAHLSHGWGCVEVDNGCDVPATDRMFVCPAEAAPQPWLAGVPQGSPPLFWPRPCPSTTDGVDDPDDLDHWGDDVDGIATGRVMCGYATGARAPPTHLGTIGAHERWQTELVGRNGGVAVAEMDRETNRHRWLFVSRGCVNGTTIRWLGEGDGIAIGEALSRNELYGDSLFAIALERGTAHRIEIEGAWVGDDWYSLDEEAFGEGDDPSETVQAFWRPRVEGTELVVRLRDRSERRIELPELAARVLAAPIEAPVAPAAAEPPPALADTTLAPGSVPAASPEGPPEPASLVEDAPLTDEMRSEQGLAGALGLAAWTLVGIAGGVWLALRWRRTQRR